MKGPVLLHRYTHEISNIPAITAAAGTRYHAPVCVRGAGRLAGGGVGGRVEHSLCSLSPVWPQEASSVQRERCSFPGPQKHVIYTSGRSTESSSSSPVSVKMILVISQHVLIVPEYIIF